MNACQLSVIIPTLNGGKRFRQLLQLLSTQSVIADELIVVDSDSTDDTVAIAREFKAKIIQISRQEFDHGATRTMAVKESRGEIVLFFTQDAVPASADVIKNLITPLVENKKIAISYGRQLPNKNATLFARTLRTFNYPAISVVRKFADRKQCGLKTAFVSNSCSAYKKGYLQDVGYFKERLIFGEDTCCAGKLLKKGYQVAYVAEAAVFHSHNYSVAAELHRSFDIGVLHSKESWLLETFGRAEGEGLKYIRFEFFTILKEKKLFLLPVFFCRNLAKLTGYKLGRKYYAIPRWLCPKLSMNNKWWSSRRG